MENRRMVWLRVGREVVGLENQPKIGELRKVIRQKSGDALRAAWNTDFLDSSRVPLGVLHSG